MAVCSNQGKCFYRNPEQAMKPVFERLAELEIPQGAFSTPESPVSTMTLVQELDDIIVQELINPESDQSEESENSEGTEKTEQKSGSSEESSKNFDHAEIEMVLARLGGFAPIESFLREIAKHKGFKRLGKNIRKELEAELKKIIA